MRKITYIVTLFLIVLGISDAGYLAYETLSGQIPPCTIGAFADCGRVLSSPYAKVFGVPLAIIGIGYYLALLTLVISARTRKHSRVPLFLLGLSASGFLASLYFVYLQLVVIKAVCLYCLVSAILSTVICITLWSTLPTARKRLIASMLSWKYKYVLKPLLFKIDPETVHVHMVKLGEIFAGKPGISNVTSWALNYSSPRLEQKFEGIHFKNPIGLSAGFDYNAQLTQSLAGLGFGFQSVGTITRYPSEGNATPRLGRLPESKSLMVNKGFRNPGVEAVVAKLAGKHFPIPVGLSVGRTNTDQVTTVDEAINEIGQTFQLFEKAQLEHSYYELNISCPNLKGNITFYDPNGLDALLSHIKDLNLSRPVFIKMPIEKSNEQTQTMLEVASNYPITGVIIGNLQKNRHASALLPREVAHFPVGNFSGKATWQRSNELIALTFREFSHRFTIIGCGGVFSAQDAYVKIRLGASLIQLITGMIFEGPQLISQINQGLDVLLEKDGFDSISSAVGIDA